MKKALITLLLFPLLGMTQSIENVDYISPFHNGVAAIKKGDTWAFMDNEGSLIINYRDDLVPTSTENASYPIFNNDRCLITHKKAGITYYGYIDKSGKTVVETQYLNATNFKDGVAIVLKLVKENLGKNDVLMKNVVNYHYFEVAINNKGEISQYLTQEPIHITLSEKYMKKLPGITSKIISENLIATRNNKKWAVRKIE